MTNEQRQQLSDLKSELKEAQQNLRDHELELSSASKKLEKALEYSEVEDIFENGECSVNDFFRVLSLGNTVTVLDVVGALLLHGSARVSIENETDETDRLNKEISELVNSAA